jgi:hypothetical protein
LGYSILHKGFKCLEPGSGRIYISRDVTFDETIFPFSELNPNVGRHLREEISLLTNGELQSNDHVTSCSTNPATNHCLPGEVLQEKITANNEHQVLNTESQQDTRHEEGLVIDPIAVGNSEQNPLIDTKIHAANEEQISHPTRPTGSGLWQVEAHNAALNMRLMHPIKRQNSAGRRRFADREKTLYNATLWPLPVCKQFLYKLKFLHPIQVILSDQTHAFVTASPRLRHTHMVLLGTMVNSDFLPYLMNHIT